MPAFSLPTSPQTLTGLLHPSQDAPLPKKQKVSCHGFGGVLKPRYIVGAESLDQ